MEWAQKSEEVFHLFDGFLSVSFIGSLIQEFSFRASRHLKSSSKLYSKSNTTQQINKTKKRNGENSE
jgi:hypothetical protein